MHLLTRVSDLPIFNVSPVLRSDPLQLDDRPIFFADQAFETQTTRWSDDGHIWNPNCWTIWSPKTILQEFFGKCILGDIKSNASKRIKALMIVNSPLRRKWDKSEILYDFLPREIGAILNRFYGTINEQQKIFRLLLRYLLQTIAIKFHREN